MTEKRMTMMKPVLILLLEAIKARPAEKAPGTRGLFSMGGPEPKMPSSCWDCGARSPPLWSLLTKAQCSVAGVNGDWCPVGVGADDLHGISRDSPIHTINKPVLI